MNIAIVGASGGIGTAITRKLADKAGTIYCCSRNITRVSQGDSAAANRVYLPIDITDESSVATVADRILNDKITLDQVFVTTGLLQNDSIQPEKTLRQFNTDTFLNLMAINAAGPILVAKHLLPLMRRDAPAFFGVLSARVGSIGDNRLGGWHSYRASKTALNMLIRNCAIEFRRTHPQLVIASLHPGTVDTDLSAPFQKNVPADKLFTADRAAAALLDVAAGLTPEHSGHCFAWDGEMVIP